MRLAGLPHNLNNDSNDRGKLRDQRAERIPDFSSDFFYWCRGVRLQRGAREEGNSLDLAVR